MNPFGLGPVVRVVNRVVDSDGKRVPYECMVGGEAFWINDTLDLPRDVARLVIHHSMYRIDPVTSQADYRLGCEKLGTPTSDLSVAEVDRVELIDRELLPPNRQNVKTVRIHNPIRRMDPLMSNTPKPNTDGAFPASFGEQN